MKKSIFNIKKVGEENVLTKTGKQKMQWGQPVTRPIFKWIEEEAEMEKIECDGEVFYVCVEETDEWNRQHRQELRTMYSEDGRILHGLFVYGRTGQKFHTGGVYYNTKTRHIVTFETGWNGATWKGHGARLVKLEPVDINLLNQ